MPKFLNKVNLPTYSAAPSSPATGDTYYNTTDNHVYTYNGTTWLNLSRQTADNAAMNYAQTQGTKQSAVSASGVTLVSTSITTSGFPVQVLVTGDAENSANGAWVKLQLYRDSTAIGKQIHVEGSAGSENIPYALTVIDTPSAGTYTYSLKTASAAAGGNFNYGETDGPVITAIELAVGIGGGGGGTGTITEVVAGDGLTGGGSSGQVTLNAVAGTGISVTSNAIAIDTTTVPVKTDNLSVFATSTSAAIGVGSIELGHATDTTITRSAAGTVAVEGVDLVKSTDSRLTDSRTPTAHATSHKSGGTDAIKLNEFAAPDADVSLNSQKITNLATPTSSADAATKAYVDGVAEGLDVKASCRLATTVAGGNIGLSGLASIDGVTPIAGDRILVKNQTAGSENGIYVADSGSWSRASDAAQSGEITPGTFVFVEEGSQADSGWVVTTNGTITIGATDIIWTQFSGAGQITAGTGITKSANTLSVDTSVVATLSDSQSLSNKTIASAVFTGDTTINAQGDLRFADSDSSHYAAIQAPATIATNYTLTLPTTDGNASEYLKTDGSGVLSWSPVATVYYQTTQPTGGTYAAGDIWIDSDDNTTPNTNALSMSTKTASYTIASDLSDYPDKVIEMNVSSANTLSVPTDATANYPIGTQIHVFQLGTGQTTIEAVTSGTTTVVGTPGTKLRAQYSFATLIKRAANYWIVVGDTAA